MTPTTWYIEEIDEYRITADCARHYEVQGYTVTALWGGE